MRKLLSSFFIILICSFMLMGCVKEIPLDLLNKNKPNNFYYTNILAKNITLEKNYKCIVMESNFFKEKELSNENKIIIENFLKLLNKKNFTNKPKDLPKNPTYKIFFKFKDSKYIINIYNEKYISVYPFDGKYPMDYIYIYDIPAAYNLLNLCNYIFKNY